MALPLQGPLRQKSLGMPLAHLQNLAIYYQRRSGTLLGAGHLKTLPLTTAVSSSFLMGRKRRANQ